MRNELNYICDPWKKVYGDVIDVRSPREFAEDHWPGSINLPVLNDAERAEIGTLYVQVDPFVARKRGAALVAQNIARHLETHFASKDKSYHPLVYCWRGGQRSGSMAMVLAQIGWAVDVLKGGYKTYRAWVREQLLELPLQFTYRILCGKTGCGKTTILRWLAAQGAQVLDLEKLANHRGSLLGQESNSPQPSQKWFESCLLQTLTLFDPDRPVWVESESAKIGQIHIPPVLWQRITHADCVEIQVPLAIRVNRLLEDYAHWAIHSDLLKKKLLLFKQEQGQARLQTWFNYIDAQNGSAFVEDILVNHYDPAYDHALRRTFSRIQETITLDDLNDSVLEHTGRILLEKS